MASRYIEIVDTRLDSIEAAIDAALDEARREGFTKVSAWQCIKHMTSWQIREAGADFERAVLKAGFVDSEIYEGSGDRGPWTKSIKLK